MISKELEQKLHEQKSRIGLVGSALNIGEYEGMKNNVEAFINPNGWDITLKVQKDFQPIQDRRQKAYARKKKITDGLEELLTDVLDHECGHWELPHGSGNGCPYDVYNHDIITEAIRKVLPKDKKVHAGYVANAFEDIIDNANCHDFRDDFSGQVLFWDHQGIECAKDQGKNGYTPFYEAFVKVNMHLWGDGADKALLKRHYTTDKRVEEAVEKVVKDLKLSEKTSVKSLFDKKRWPQMAETFARHFSPLLDVAPKERLFAYVDGTQESQGAGGEEQKSPGNGIEQKARSEEGKEEIVYGRYKGGNGPSPSFKTHEQLHALYSRLARDIPVNVQAMTREDQLAIAPLTYRKMDSEKDDPAHARLNKLYPTDEGVITFGYQKTPLVVTSREKMQRKSFPDFKLVILDNSSSMKDAIDGSGNKGNTAIIPWGDRSKYHFALLGFYGIESFIRKQGIAPFIRHGAALFSSATRYQEAGFDNIQSVYRHVLSPDWGGTQLDASALTRALKGRESFTLSLSDGEIGNWDGEKEVFRKALVDQHYAHIQIGGASEFSRDLKKWGVPVYFVSRGDDLAKLMVNAAQTTYGRFVKQQ